MSDDSELDGALEGLALCLDNMGFEGVGLTDAQLVDVATNKLRTLYDMILATGMNRDLLRAVIKH
jgi:hypothetical protein